MEKSVVKQIYRRQLQLQIQEKRQKESLQRRMKTETDRQDREDLDRGLQLERTKLRAYDAVQSSPVLLQHSGGPAAQLSKLQGLRGGEGGAGGSPAELKTADPARHGGPAEVDSFAEAGGQPGAADFQGEASGTIVVHVIEAHFQVARSSRPHLQLPCSSLSTASWQSLSSWLTKIFILVYMPSPRLPSAFRITKLGTKNRLIPTSIRIRCRQCTLPSLVLRREITLQRGQGPSALQGLRFAPRSLPRGQSSQTCLAKTMSSPWVSSRLTTVPQTWMNWASQRGTWMTNSETFSQAEGYCFSSSFMNSSAHLLQQRISRKTTIMLNRLKSQVDSMYRFTFDLSLVTTIFISSRIQPGSAATVSSIFSPSSSTGIRYSTRASRGARSAGTAFPSRASCSFSAGSRWYLLKAIASRSLPSVEPSINMIHAPPQNQYYMNGFVDDSFSCPPSHRLEAELADRDAYIEKCCGIIVAKNEENIRLNRLVDALQQQKDTAEAQRDELARQLADLQDSYIHLLASKQKSEASAIVEIEAEIKIQELQSRIRELQLERMSQSADDRVGQLLDQLEASERKVRSLEERLALREGSKKQSGNLVTPSSKGGKAGPNTPSSAYYKRFEERQYMTNQGRTKENSEVCYFKSKKGLFGVDLNQREGRRSQTPTKLRLAR